MCSYTRSDLFPGSAAVFVQMKSEHETGRSISETLFLRFVRSVESYACGSYTYAEIVRAYSGNYLWIILTMGEIIEQSFL